MMGRSSRRSSDDEDDDSGDKDVTRAIRGKVSGRNWSSQSVGQTAQNLARAQFGLHTDEQNVATANRAFGTAYNSILKTADQRLRNRTGTGSKLAEGLYKSPTLGVSYQKDKVALPFKASGFASKEQAGIHKQMGGVDQTPTGPSSSLANRPTGPYAINPNYDPAGGPGDFGEDIWNDNSKDPFGPAAQQSQPRLRDLPGAIHQAYKKGKAQANAGPTGDPFA